MRGRHAVTRRRMGSFAARASVLAAFLIIGAWIGITLTLPQFLLAVVALATADAVGDHVR